MTKKAISSGATMLAFVFITTACGPNQRIMQSANENAAASSGERVAVNSSGTPMVSSFEQDINAMRTADFNFIYVFRRRDGAPLNADDKGYLSETISSEINRRRVSDEGRAVIIGSNFRLSPDLMKVFKERFAVEDHSKSESQAANGNSRS